MNNQKEKGISSLLGIIIVIVIAVVGVGTILTYQFLWTPEEEAKAPEEVKPPEEEEKTPKEPVKKDETADWKTYRNEEYGFEIKYPVDWWVAGEGGGEGEGVLSLFSVNIRKDKEGPFGMCMGCPGFFIEIYDKDFLKGVGAIEGSYWEMGKDMMVGKHPAKKVLFRKGGEYWSEEFFYILQNNYDYKITPSVPRIGGVGVNLEEEVNKHIPEFYDILSTFKFIK